MPRFLRLLSLLLACAGACAAEEEIVRLPSLDGAVLPYLLSRETGADYPLAAILFTGGEGQVGLLQKGIPQPGGNFLVRHRGRFIAHGIATAVIDAPSDSNGMSDTFRRSERHAADVGAVAADLRARFAGARIFLVGTSRGTVSAAYAGAALGKRIDGVVLSSSLFNATRSGSGLAGFDYARIAVPLLFVHHVGDGCFATPYHAAAGLAERYPLISVHGGAAPKSGPCDPFSPHGYFGKEEETVRAMANWMLGQPFDARID